MDDKTLKMAYATPVLAAVINKNGCDDLDACIETTISLLNKLNSKL